MQSDHPAQQQRSSFDATAGSGSPALGQPRVGMKRFFTAMFSNGSQARSSDSGSSVSAPTKANQAPSRMSGLQSALKLIQDKMTEARGKVIGLLGSLRDSFLRDMQPGGFVHGAVCGCMTVVSRSELSDPIIFAAAQAR